MSSRKKQSEDDSFFRRPGEVYYSRFGTPYRFPYKCGEFSSDHNIFRNPWLTHQGHTDSNIGWSKHDVNGEVTTKPLHQSRPHPEERHRLLSKYIYGKDGNIPFHRLPENEQLKRLIGKSFDSTYCPTHFNQMEGSEVADKIGTADLTIKVPHTSPQKVAPATAPWKLRHLRKEYEWITARLAEDKQVLFDGSYCNPQEVVIEPDHIPLEDRIKGWKDIDQSRYFWDFADAYMPSVRSRQLHVQKEKTERTKLKGDFSNCMLSLISEKIKDDKESEKQKAKMNLKPIEYIQFDYLPSIYDEPPPTFRREKKGKRLIHSSRLHQYGKQIDTFCGLPPLNKSLHRYLSNVSEQKLSPRIERILSYFYQKEIPPPGMQKTFNELYSTITKEMIQKLNDDIQAKEAAMKQARDIESGALVLPTEKREARKIAGGRYAIR